MVMLARRPSAIAVDEPARRGGARVGPLARAALLGAGALLGAAGGCSHPPPVPVTVVLDGAAAPVAEVRGLLGPTAVAELRLRHAAISPPADVELGAAEVAAAYQDFVAGDGSRCRERLAAVDLPRLLAHRQRTAVARALLLDARCAEGLGNPAAADARFAEFAGYELDLAETSGVLSPALRPRFDQALARAAQAPRVRLAVDGASGGRVLIDGRLAGCAAPCTPAVSQGAHVIAIEADGVALAWRKVSAEGPARAADGKEAAPQVVALPQAAASAAEATQQWHARAGSGFAPDDAAGLRLLPLIARDDRVVYLRVAAPSPSSAAAAAAGTGGTAGAAAPPTLAGALVVRRPGEAAPATVRGQRLTLEAAPALVRQLAIDAKLIAAPRPRWFWPVLIGSVVTTAAVTAALLYQPETRTEVSF